MSEAFLGVEQSLTGRRWRLRAPESDRAALAIAQRLGAPEIVGRVLAGRGVAVEAAAEYLAPSLRDLMPDPSTLKDMDAAAERLAAAARKGERVALFGDYDVDGAASTALLRRWFSALGSEATVYIPDRLDEGYGLNIPAMAALAKDHSLIVALDCGTLSHEPVAAVAGAADVVILDHHLAGETLPAALAVVNPNRPDDESGLGHLCAAGVAFMALAAANRVLRKEGFPGGSEPNLLELLDLVALATVADVAPLTGLNRAFVTQGLKVMANRRNPGLRALADVARLETRPDAYHLGFVFGPRVNAGGRVGRADWGARLLTVDDPAEAAKLAAQLDRCNQERRAIEAEVLAAADAQAAARFGEDGPGALVWAAGEGWHPGVVGIVASRLKEKYNRPAIVVGLEKGEGKGSGRSVAGVDLGSAVQDCAAEGLLLKGGGHRMAAGLTVAEDRLEDAMAWLAEALARQGADTLGPADLLLDGAVVPAAATAALCETLTQAGPYGAGAPAPRFALANVQVRYPKPVGESHLRCLITDASGARLEAIAFRAYEGPLGPFIAGLAGDPVHLCGRLALDQWGGRRMVKLQIDDAAAPR